MSGTLPEARRLADAAINDLKDERRCFRELRFVVDGRPVGYYAQGKTPAYGRMMDYHRYKIHVQEVAALLGLRLPLRASRERPLWIETVAYFANGVHADPENVHKGIKDALFWEPKVPGVKRKGGGDKYTGGSYAPPKYDAEHPRVEILIREM